MLPRPVVSSAVTVDARVAGGDQENESAGIGFGWHKEAVGDRPVRDLSAGSGQSVAVAAGCGLHRSVTHFAVQGNGEDLLAAHRGGTPLLLEFGGAEPGQRSGGQHHRVQVGYGGQLVAEADQYGDFFEDAEPASTQGFWCGGGEDVGVDKFAPQLAVEPLVETVKLALMFGRAYRVDDRRDQTTEVLRGFGC